MALDGGVGAGYCLATERFDVFLSYHGADRAPVERIASALRGLGVRPWLDAWQLLAGERWQDGLAMGLERSDCCAVFVGPASFGNWEREEIDVAVDRAARDPAFRVFLALLPGLPDPF